MKTEKCKLCRGTGDNESGVTMKVNNSICPRCGGYGVVPASSATYDSGNVKTLTDQDNGYIDNNGRVEAGSHIDKDKKKQADKLLRNAGILEPK